MPRPRCSKFWSKLRVFFRKISKFEAHFEILELLETLPSLSFMVRAEEGDYYEVVNNEEGDYYEVIFKK